MKKVNEEEQEYLKKLGERIEMLRKERGLTQVELAEKIGTKFPQIGRLERGETNCTIIVLRKIARELNTPLNKIITIE
ncbi:MAG TPA: helix-turn-helix domain-containing protein [Bacteroidia bacterium]|nr:helix-turn-helix domain-containing protein [Bacteroidia bacterium]